MLSNYYHTIKHLKFIQIYGRIIFKFKKPKINLAPPPALNYLRSSWTTPIIKASTFRAPNKLIFLNQEKDISSAAIWTDKTLDKLWLYNLHYFDCISDQSFIDRWIKENPPGRTPGWEPYPTSLRIVNWIKWILAGNPLTDAMHQSLAVQMRYLCQRLEIHLLGNHLLANAKALLFSGLFFRGKEATAWFKKGMRIFQKQLTEQILKDGAHFELSPMYHSIILEDLLDIINLFKTFGESLPKHWIEISDKMFYWLQNLCHFDGKISFFNDAALGVAPTLRELQEYKERLQFSFPQKYLHASDMQYFAESGYCRMQQQSILLLVDIANIGASYQPGHGHADALSFELSFGQQRLMVNSGTSLYADNQERLRQRGSQAHNTLVINDRDSSHLWKSFRVARRANIFDIKINKTKDYFLLQASHDGYYHRDKIYHLRAWKLSADELLITDEVSGLGVHKIALFFHIHPDVTLKQEEDGSIIFYDLAGSRLAVFKTHHIPKILDSTYHPEFNVSVANKKIVVEMQANLPACLHTSIKFNLAGQT